MQVYNTRTTLPHEIDVALITLKLYESDTPPSMEFTELFGGNVLVCSNLELPVPLSGEYDLDEVFNSFHVYGIVTSDAGGNVYVVYN